MLRRGLAPGLPEPAGDQGRACWGRAFSDGYARGGRVEYPLRYSASNGSRVRLDLQQMSRH
jgi:hypothetical protein